MPALLVKLAALSTRSPRAILATAILLSLPMAVIGSQLDISTSRTALVSEENPKWRRYMVFAQEFGIPEDLVVVIKAEDPAVVHTFADRVAQQLSQQPEQVNAVFHRVDLAVFEDYGPLYVELSDLEMLARLAKSPAFAKMVAKGPPAARVDGLAELLETLPSVVPQDEDPQETDQMVASLVRLLLGLEAYALNESAQPLSLVDKQQMWQASAARRERSGLDADGYLTTDGGKTGIVFVRPTYTRDEREVVVSFVQLVRSICAETQKELPAVQYGLTGLPASNVDELDSITRDTILTSLVAIVGVVLLFLFHFPALRLLALCFAPVLFGVVWTAAVIEMLIGHINLLSSIFLVVLIGMGIDFSVHLAARFLEQRRRGEGVQDAVQIAVERAGRGVLTGAVTSAGAFLAVTWSGFKGIEELGLAASVGLLLTLVASFTVFPALLVLFGQSIPGVEARTVGLRPLVHGVLRFKVPVLFGALGLTVVMTWFGLRTPFDFSLLNLLPKNAESARFMAEMVEKRDLSANAVAMSTGSLEEARALENKLRTLDSVHSVVSAASFLPPNQTARLHALSQIKQGIDAARAQAEPSQTTWPEALERLELSVERLSELAFRAERKAAVDRLDEGLDAVANVREAFDENQPKATAGLDAYAAALLKLVEQLSQRINAVHRLGPMTADILPPNLKGRFVSERQRYAVYAVPKASVWDRPQLGAFLQDVRNIAPQVTGFPETYYDNAGLIQKGFLTAALYAAIAVILLLWLDLRSLSMVVYALIPMGFGALWMLGTMYLISVPYNLANIVGLPLIIGVGIDNGVHLIHRYRESGSVEVASVQTGGAVVLSSLTTMVGFGSLAFASHRGYSSLGQILFIGVGTCLLMAVTVLPAALACRDARRRRGVG